MKRESFVPLHWTAARLRDRSRYLNDRSFFTLGQRPNLRLREICGSGYNKYLPRISSCHRSDAARVERRAFCPGDSNAAEPAQEARSRIEETVRRA